MSAPQMPEPVPVRVPEGAPTWSERLMKKVTASRDVLDPPTPVRLVLSGTMFVAVAYLTVHFIRSLYEDDSINKAIYPLYWVGIVSIALFDLGWMSKKRRAKLERRRAESARWRETIAAHNARVAALAPPSGPTSGPAS